MTGGPIDTVVFDLGGVLIDWNPRYLYRSLFDGDDAAMERFLADVCTPEWNHRQDEGRPWADAVAELVARWPEHRERIEAYDRRWPETLGGPIVENVALLAELRRTPRRLFALSNWSAEKFPVALARYEFLSWFDGILISGEVGVAKPDPAIFHHLVERFGIEPASTVFIDDHAANVETGAALGFAAIHYREPSTLRGDLRDLGLVGSAADDPAQSEGVDRS